MKRLLGKATVKLLTLSIVYCFLWANGAGASSVKLIVSDAGQNKECSKRAQGDNPEVVSYSTTSQALEVLVLNFLENRSNPHLIDAALTNAGIVFCGHSEAEKFSRFLLNQLNSTKLPKRLMPMIEQYGRLRTLRTELDKLLTSQEISEEYRNNLLRAKVALEKHNKEVVGR
jgi:hypothetical protein